MGESAVTYRIDAERVYIRGWQASDRPIFRALVDDIRVTRYLGRGAVWSDEHVDEFFARQQRHLENVGFCMGAMVRKEDDRVIGLAGLQPLRKGNDVETGWWLAPDVWGHGYAAEAAGAAVAYGLNVLQLPRVVAIAHPDNEPSLAVMRKIGMTFAGRFTGEELGIFVAHPEVVMYALSSRA
jgi:RimJ/RimL family protein N-acetyltransferase